MFVSKLLLLAIVMMRQIKDSILFLLRIQYRKYLKKGAINVTIAILLLSALITAFWKIGKELWIEDLQDRRVFLALATTIINISVQCLAYLIYLPGYSGWAKSYQSHLINKKGKKPWEKPNWQEHRTKIVKNFVVIQLILYPLIVFLFANTTKLQFSGFPSLATAVKHLLFIYYVDDFFFYIIHRFFHILPSLYQYHKMHHQFVTCYVWATEYFHPIEYVLGILLPAVIPVVLLGNSLHCFTFLLWNLYKASFSSENHSGYEFEWSPFRILPFIANNSFHDRHHSHNTGDYGSSCYLWDFVFKTLSPALMET